MSLKIFHVLFIALSILTTFGFSLWCLQSYYGNPDIQMVVFGIPSAMIGLGLVFYSKWFFDKLRNWPVGVNS